MVEYGVQSVMTAGTQQMPVLLADSLDFLKVIIDN